MKKLTSTAAKKRNKLSFFLVFYFVWTTGCNHLLYPAVREPFFLQSSIKPIPQDLYIPVLSPEKGMKLHAWFFPSQAKVKKNRVVVHFHGNGQNLTTHFLFFKWMIDYGYDYLIFDYRGYGASSGDDTSQQSTVEDGEAIFKYVRENFKDQKIIAIGQSLGSNVLVRTLQELNRKNHVDLLPQFVVLDSSFLSYQSAASAVLGQHWFSYPLKPLSYMVISDKWSAENQLKYTPKLPALFFHGTADSTITYELGQKNFGLWPGPKIFSTQTGGGHTSAFGNDKFIQSRRLLLNCLDQALADLTKFESCVN